MALQAPWSVKGVDVRAREAAKLMARRAGLTLGEWLNRAILEEASRPEPDQPPVSAARPADAEAIEALGREVIALARALDRRLRLAESKLRGLAETDARSAEAIDDLAQRLRDSESRLADWINAARAAGGSRPLGPTPFDLLAADAALPDGPSAQDLFETTPPMEARAEHPAAATGASSLTDDDADFIPIPARAPPGAGVARRRAAADRRVAVVLASAACCLALAGAGLFLLRDRPQTPVTPVVATPPPAPQIDPAIARLEGMAAAGDPAAMHELGLAYFNGDGAPKDLPRAVRWFRAAAEKGLAPAQHNLAMMYAAGSGAPRDPVEACAWFSVAATAGDAEAGKALREIWKGLTPDQRQAANARVATLRGALRI